ncbi:MAG TPA: SH3 domain-containing protein [Rhizomicrobium sp.]|nr:SH3 domain-containing protein [Rhizomicrobium sp.]
MLPQGGVWELSVMALRGTGFAKRPAGPVTVQASAAGRAPHDAEPPIHAIPLDLAPLISPYRGQGRISLRVERLPHRTRLSRGQNNGDRSWSLVLDDLEGLQFLAPKDLVGEQTISIRVVSLDGGDGATIAVLEHSISPLDSPRITAVEGGRSLHDAGPEHAANERLRIELAEAKAARAAQEAMLADVRQGLESDWEVRAGQMVRAELAAARTAWEAETKEQLAELARREAASLEQSRKTWQAEEENRLIKAELEYRRELEQERQLWRKEYEVKLAQLERDAKASEAARLAAEDKLRLLASKGETYERARSEFEADLAKAKSAWKEGEADRLAEAQAQWQLKAVAGQTEAHERLRREFEADLAKVQKVWKDGEANRLAAAKAEWQAQSERVLAESRNRSTDEAQMLRAKAESDWKAQADARLSDAQAVWQQQSAKALADERARAERELHSALEAAQRVWKTGEAARLASAEAKWREESAKLISQANAGNDDTASNAGQVDGLRDELAIAHATLANREAELAQLRQTLEHAGDGARRDAELALADARKTWSEEEADRLAAARAQWNEQSSRELAQARTLLEQSVSEEARQLREVREELALAKAKLAERDGELAQARHSAEAENEELRRQGEVALEQAREQWNAEEAGRLATVEAKWREQFAASQTKPSTEGEAADVPAQSAPQAEAPALRDSVEVLRLRDDVERLKQKMAIREVELAQARATAEQARARLTGEPLDLLTRPHSDRVLISTGRNRTLPQQSIKKSMPWRDIGIVGAIAVVIFIFYPHIMALLPNDWWPDSSYSDDVEPAPAKPSVVKPAPTPPETPPTDVILKQANVHTAPSKTSALVSTLAANVAVRTLERRGNWVHIAFTVGKAKEDGWVYATYLEALPPAAGAPNTAK